VSDLTSKSTPHNAVASDSSDPKTVFDVGAAPMEPLAPDSREVHRM